MRTVKKSRPMKMNLLEYWLNESMVKNAGCDLTTAKALGFSRSQAEKAFSDLSSDSLGSIPSVTGYSADELKVFIEGDALHITEAALKFKAGLATEAGDSYRFIYYCLLHCLSRLSDLSPDPKGFVDFMVELNIKPNMGALVLGRRVRKEALVARDTQYIVRELEG